MSQKLIGSEQLYSREREIESLLESYKEIESGHLKFVLISGSAGIGKTSLVNEIRHSCIKRGAFFISGKFEQDSARVPYAALIQTFQVAARNILTSSRKEIEQWKTRLKSAININSHIILEMIPELEGILDPQFSLKITDREKSRNRFERTLIEFVRALSRPNHPLVLFLDDMQWSDSGSIRIIKLILNHLYAEPLLLIGAYREHDINSNNSLKQIVKGMAGEKYKRSIIKLKPLEQNNISNLLEDQLNIEANDAEEFTQIVLNKTGGNPYYIYEFLNYLIKDQYLFQKSENQQWQWNNTTIQNIPTTKNIVDFLIGRIHKLSAEALDLLGTIACSGRRFTRKFLKKLNSEHINKLYELCEAGLIFEIENGDYQFVHDRIQQASLEMIPERNKKELFLRIGHLMLNGGLRNVSNDLFFSAVFRLNQACELIIKKTKRYDLACLNLVAGRRAKTISAYDTAYQYLKQGLKLLESDYWKIKYEFSFNLHIETAEAAYLVGEFGETRRLVQLLIKKTTDQLDKIKIYEVQIQAYIKQNKLKAAIEVALEALRILGIKFPANYSDLNIYLEFLKTRLLIAFKGIKKLENLPEMKDPHKMAAMRILSIVGGSAYLVDPRLLPFIIFKSMNLSILHGNHSSSPFTYTAYGLFLCGVAGKINQGFRFGRMAIKLQKKLQNRESETKTYMLLNAFIRHWKAHPRKALASLMKTYRAGQKYGDLEYAANAIYSWSYFHFVIGQNLKKTEFAMNQCHASLYLLNQKSTLNSINIFRQTVKNLMGNRIYNEQPFCLKGPYFDEKAITAEHSSINDQNTLFNYHLNKLMLFYLFYQYKEARKSSLMAEKYLLSALSSAAVPVYYFYDSLIIAAFYSAAGMKADATVLRKLAANEKKMKRWARYAPMNYRHKYILMKAERLSFLGHEGDLSLYYNDAACVAKENGYLQEEALAQERAALYFSSRGRKNIAVACAREAHHLYNEWGAHAKTLHLEKHFPEIQHKTRKHIISSAINPFNKTSPVFSKKNQLYQPKNGHKITTLAKFSPEIITEVADSNSRFGKIINDIMDISGADKGFMISIKKGEPFVEAEMNVIGSLLRTKRFISAEINKNYPTALFNFIMRTGKEILLSEPAHQEWLMNDVYLTNQRPEYIHCLPIKRKQNVIGILYLEKNSEFSSGSKNSETLRALLLHAFNIIAAEERADDNHG